MSKFIKIIINRKHKDYKNIKFLPQVLTLFRKYSRYLNDDFFVENEALMIDGIINLIENCGSFFWVVVDKETDKFAGFVFMDNLIGNKKSLYSAEVTTCFAQEFWGNFTKETAKKFIKYVFKKYKIKKLKACIFPQNFRVKGYLKRIGFKYEALLKSETMKKGEPQDIEVYSILKPNTTLGVKK